MFVMRSDQMAKEPISMFRMCAKASVVIEIAHRDGILGNRFKVHWFPYFFFSKLQSNRNIGRTFEFELLQRLRASHETGSPYQTHTLYTRKRTHNSCGIGWAQHVLYSSIIEFSWCMLQTSFRCNDKRVPLIFSRNALANWKPARITQQQKKEEITRCFMLFSIHHPYTMRRENRKISKLVLPDECKNGQKWKRKKKKKIAVETFSVNIDSTHSAHATQTQNTPYSV